MKEMQLGERILGFIVGVCSIINLIYCFTDAPSGISRIDLITICLIRQSLLFIPLVVCGLVDFIHFMINELKDTKEKQNESNND